MDKSSSRVSNNHSASQEISRLLWSPPLVPILSQINRVHTFPPNFSKIHSNVLQSLPMSFKCSLSFSLSDQNSVSIFNLPMHAAQSIHYIVLDLITLIIFIESYKLWSSSLCSLLQPLATSSQLGPNILFSTLFSDIFNLCCSLSLREIKFHTHKKRRAQL